MRKFIFVLLFSIFMVTVTIPANGQTTNNNVTIEQLNNRIAELEGELRSRNQIAELEDQIKELENENEVTVTDMYTTLLNQEKQVSSKLYDFVMVFISVIVLFVTVAGIYLSFLFRRLGKHQKKIDLVLDSKDFDKKVNEIEKRLASLRMKERESKKSLAIHRCETICMDIGRLVHKINIMKARPGILIESAVMEKILEENEWNDLLSTFQKEHSDFIDLSKKEITFEDDEDEGQENLEDDLSSYADNFESMLKEFEKVHEEIYQNMNPKS